LTKLAGLLVKTLAKPLSKRIKTDFSRYQTTQNLLVGVGQLTHQVTSRMTIWSAGYKVRSIKPLEAEDAVKKGAEIIGESFVFLVAGGVVVVEYDSSSKKAKLKEEKRLLQMKKENDELDRKLNALDARLKALEKVVVKNRMELLKNTSNNNSLVDPHLQSDEQIHQRTGWWPWKYQ